MKTVGLTDFEKDGEKSRPMWFITAKGKALFGTPKGKEEEEVTLDEEPTRIILVDGRSTFSESYTLLRACANEQLVVYFFALTNHLYTGPTSKYFHVTRLTEPIDYMLTWITCSFAHNLEDKRHYHIVLASSDTNLMSLVNIIKTEGIRAEMVTSTEDLNIYIS